MELMEIRRGLMMGSQNATIDTSPLILKYDAVYNVAGNATTVDGYCITDMYYYNELSSTGTIAYNGTGSKTAVVYTDNG